MKIVYRKPVTDQIDEALSNAAYQKKTIEYIEITQDELYELRNSVKSRYLVITGNGRVSSVYYRGVRIELETEY